MQISLSDSPAPHVAASCRSTLTSPLDDGRLFSAGFGAIGQGSECLESLQVLQVQQVQTEAPVRAIAGGYGCFAAITNTDEVLLYGLNCKYGRLGTGQLSNVHSPQAVAFRSLQKPVEKIESVVMGANSVYILLREVD